MRYRRRRLVWTFGFNHEEAIDILGIAAAMAEAEPILRADLGLDESLPRPHRHPDNVWALHGLDECLALRGETVERVHVRTALAHAVARADVPIRAACYCRSKA